MKNKLTLRQPSNELMQLIDAAIRTIHTSAGMVERAFIKGRSEGFSDQQIGRMIKNHMLSLGYDPSTIRKVLPASAKDTTKTRKDYLNREQYSNDRLHERKIPSYENHNGIDGNRTPEEPITELKDKVSELQSHLDNEHIKNEDLTIQLSNANNSITKLRGDLNAARNTSSILIITSDNFPPDYGRVFSSEGYVFAVEFKDSKVLDISVKSK